MLTNVKPGDCIRLTEDPQQDGHIVGDAAIVEEVSEKHMVLVWLRLGTRDGGYRSDWPGWEKVDA